MMCLIDNRLALARFGRDAIENWYSLIPIDRETKQPYFRLLPFLYTDSGDPVLKDWTNPETGEVKTFHARGWKPYQDKRATVKEINAWTRQGAQLAVVAGSVSGGLLIIDFDAPGFFFRWMRACKRAGYDLSSLPVQRTGGGGWQVFLNCDHPGENMKLAWVNDTTQRSGRSIAIETRAEGGYAVVAPSFHPSGNQYIWRRHTLIDTPHVDQCDVDAILDIAQSLSEVPDTPPPACSFVARERYAGESVIDAYNDRTSIEDELARFGYMRCGSRMHRPGYTPHSRPSAYIKGNRSFHHSTNDELLDGYWKTPFEVRYQLEFGRDVTRAVRTIASELGMAYVRPMQLHRSAAREYIRSKSILAAYLAAA